MDEIYGQTKHFTFYSQHEESVIWEMIKFYIEYCSYGDHEFLKVYKNTAEELKTEIADMPCGCGTCKADREKELKRV